MRRWRWKEEGRSWEFLNFFFFFCDDMLNFAHSPFRPLYILCMQTCKRSSEENVFHLASLQLDKMIGIKPKLSTKCPTTAVATAVDLEKPMWTKPCHSVRPPSRFLGRRIPAAAPRPLDLPRQPAKAPVVSVSRCDSNNVACPMRVLHFSVVPGREVSPIKGD